MANLLPKEALHSMRSANRARFVLVGALVGGICGIIVLFALVPAYTIVSAGAGASEESLQLSALPPSTDRDDIAHAQVLVRQLKPTATSTVSALGILNEVFAARPPETTISTVSYTRGDPGTIVIGGVAPSRDAINAYKSTLSKNPRFKSVSVPIGVLTGSEDGHFNMTLMGTF